MYYIWLTALHFVKLLLLILLISKMVVIQLCIVHNALSIKHTGKFWIPLIHHVWAHSEHGLIQQEKVLSRSSSSKTNSCNVDFSYNYAEVIPIWTMSYKLLILVCYRYIVPLVLAKWSKVQSTDLGSSPTLTQKITLTLIILLRIMYMNNHDVKTF